MSLITTGKAARLAGVTNETIRNYVETGKLTVVQRTPGGHFRLDETEVRGKLCRMIALEELLT